MGRGRERRGPPQSLWFLWLRPGEGGLRPTHLGRAGRGLLPCQPDSASGSCRQRRLMQLKVTSRSWAMAVGMETSELAGAE